MRALVTGSTGLLGNNLVRTLLDAGHEVWALARSKEKARRELLGDTAVQVVVGDIRNVADFAYGTWTVVRTRAVSEQCEPAAGKRGEPTCGARHYGNGFLELVMVPLVAFPRISRDVFSSPPRVPLMNYDLGKSFRKVICISFYEIRSIAGFFYGMAKNIEERTQFSMILQYFNEPRKF